MATTFDIVSIGKACEILQRHPATIREAAEQAGLAPTARINCIDHYDRATLEQIAEQLKKRHHSGPVVAAD